MKPGKIVLLVSVAVGMFVRPTSAEVAPASLNYWPQWRGPLSTGTAPLANPPVTWSETKNVRWKIPLPGDGLSTPIVWKDQVFILTAIPKASKEESAAGESPNQAGAQNGTPSQVYQFVLLCFDRKTGKTLWQKIAVEQVPHEGHQENGSFAPASPVTDGEHVIAYFGSRGMYCYDMNGELQWSKDFGDMQTRRAFGEGSSPALHGNTVVVLWDHEGDDDFLVALDKRTGKELWRTPRNEHTSWTTPLIVDYNGTPQVVVPGTTAVRDYDLTSGKELWTGPALTANVIPSAVYADGVVYAISGFRGSALHAIQLGHTGDLNGSDAVLWSYKRNTPYVPSPLLVDHLLYFVSVNNGILSCLNAKTGEANFAAERLEGIRGIYASPVAAKDHIYVLGRDGSCLVLKKDAKLETVAVNQIDDHTDASMAIAGNDLFIRGHQKLYCIAQD